MHAFKIDGRYDRIRYVQYQRYLQVERSILYPIHSLCIFSRPEQGQTDH